MKKFALIGTVITTALVATAALAQNGPGMGMEGGYGGGGRFAWDKNQTPGWMLMTDQERTEWQNKMRNVQTYDECTKMRDEHHKAMELRAKEKGVTLATPRRNGCDMMKARGFFK